MRGVRHGKRVHRSSDQTGSAPVAALAMASGPEPMTALRDVARLSPDEAVEVSGWVVRALLAATLGNAGRGRRQSGNGPPS